MSLNLRQVRAFVAVIEGGSFLAASRALGWSQPAVTQLVRKLEETLGALLVARDRRGSVPTAAGALFLPHARGLLRAEAAAIGALHDRRLLVGAGGNVGTYLLPAEIARFESRHGRPVELAA